MNSKTKKRNQNQITVAISETSPTFRFHHLHHGSKSYFIIPFYNSRLLQKQWVAWSMQQLIYSFYFSRMKSMLCTRHSNKWRLGVCVGVRQPSSYLRMALFFQFSHIHQKSGIWNWYLCEKLDGITEPTSKSVRVSKIKAKMCSLFFFLGVVTQFFLGSGFKLHSPVKCSQWNWASVSLKTPDNVFYHTFSGS